MKGWKDKIAIFYSEAWNSAIGSGSPIIMVSGLLIYNKCVFKLVVNWLLNSQCY